MKSKRLQKVVNKFLNPQETSETPPVASTEDKSARGRRKTKGKDTTDAEDKVKVPDTQEAGTTQIKAGKGGRGRGQRKKKAEIDEVPDDSIPDAIDEDSKLQVNCTKSRGRGRGRGRGKGRGQSSMGKTDKPGTEKLDKIPETIEFTSSTSDTESDPDTWGSGITSSDSDEAMSVTQSALSVAEILGLKMGDHKFEESSEPDMEVAGPSGLGGSKTRVFETGLKVEELMKLEGGDGEMEDVSDAWQELGEDGHEKTSEGMEVADVAKSDSEDGEFYKNEGGFIREEKTEDENSKDSSKLEFSEVKSRQKSKHEKLNKPQLVELDKMETKIPIISSSTGCGHKDMTVTEDPSSGIVNMDTEQNGKKSLGKNLLKRKAQPNTDSQKIVDTRKKRKKTVVQNTSIKATTKTQINETCKDDKDVDSNIKLELKDVPDRKPDVYSTEPIRKTASGVPWADLKRKKGQKGRGGGCAGSVRRSMQPVEKIERRQRGTNTARKPVGVVNLSESSDSDSSS